MYRYRSKCTKLMIVNVIQYLGTIWITNLKLSTKFQSMYLINGDVRRLGRTRDWRRLMNTCTRAGRAAGCRVAGARRRQRSSAAAGSRFAAALQSQLRRHDLGKEQ
jgi:hypothetical protein